MSGQKEVLNGFLKDLDENNVGYLERKQMAALIN